MADPIFQFDPRRRTNAAAIVDCVTLGYLNADQLIFDATFGKEGGFWKLWRPILLVTNDRYEAADLHQDYCDTKIHDDAFDVTVFDPPYKLNGTGGSHESDRRFGVATPYIHVNDIQADHSAGLTEMVRITKPGGLILYKTKDQVTSAHFTPLSKHAWHTMAALRCDLVDQIYVNSWIPQPGNRTKKCPTCKGTGWIEDAPGAGPDGSRSGCPDCTPDGGCGGTGRQPSVQEHFYSNCSVLQIYRKPRRKR